MNTLSDETDYTSEEENPEPIETAGPQSHDSFLFGYRACDIDLSTYHPPAHLIPFLWKVYQVNVEPAIKLIHTPTVDKVFQGIINGNRELSPPNEALVFAIYYASLVALEEDEVRDSRCVYQCGFFFFRVGFDANGRVILGAREVWLAHSAPLNSL